MDDLKSKISAILSEAENSSSTPTQTKNIKIDNSTKNQGNFIFSFKNQGNHIYLQGSLIIAFLLINSLEFFINSFNFCRGKRGVFLCTATECRRGWQRKATGCQGLWRRVSGTAGSCGEPCADGQPGRLCGRAGALTGFQRGVDNNQQLAGTGDDSGHF